MLPTLQGRALWITLLCLSILWVVGTFGPLLYSIVSPNEQISAILLALQGQGVPPPASETLVKQTIDQGGSLQRSIHVARHVDATVMHEHTTTVVSDIYIAWFSKIPASIPLIVTLYTRDGQPQRYEIGEAQSTMPLVQGYSLPLLALSLCIFFVRRRSSAILREPSNQTTQTTSE